jgi:hypothetical protein
MNAFFAVAIPLALAAVLVVLAAGLWNMKRGGSASRSQSLMRARIVLQFVALVIVMTALYISQQG